MNILDTIYLCVRTNSLEQEVLTITLKMCKMVFYVSHPCLIIEQ